MQKNNNLGFVTRFLDRFEEKQTNQEALADIKFCGLTLVIFASVFVLGLLISAIIA
jgi:hypothetical protein